MTPPDALDAPMPSPSTTGEGEKNASLPAGPTAQSGARLVELVAIMKRLLAPDGCPWDQEQTLDTLKPFLIEESYEVLDALDANNPPEHCEELGDLLFQIVFQAELRAREGAFGIDDVVAAIARKMIRRHPHVFGDVKVADSTEVLANWDKWKAAEHAEKGKKRRTLDGVPGTLPALLLATRIGERAARVGFDWPDLGGVRDKVNEEVAELDEAIARGDKAAITEELGDVLFTLTRLGSKLGVEPEDALRACVRRFRSRFESMEEVVAGRGQELGQLSLAEMDTLWRAAKLSVRAAESQAESALSTTATGAAAAKLNSQNG